MKTSSRIFLVLALIGLIASPALAQSWGTTYTGMNMTSTSATGAQSSMNTDGTTSVLFHVTSGSTSTASVLFQQSIDGTHWYTSATITDPAAAGELWACPAAKFARFNVSTHSAGTLQGYLAARSMAADPVAQNCKKIDAQSQTFGAMNATSLTDSGLTSGRVPFAGTGGLLQDSSVFTFSAGTLSATTFTGAFTGGAVTSSTLTATRIPYVGTAGLLQDLANFTYTTATGALVNTAGTAPSISTARFLSTGTAPTVANVGVNSCGTTAATIAGKDQASVTTVGATSGTECRVSFNVAFTNAPVCTASATIATDLHLVTTTADVTVTGTLTAAEKIYLICLGY